MRPPKWPASNANDTHKYGTPVELFAGTTADAFDYQAGTYPITWKVEDGVLTNEPPTRNLVSKQKFWNFRLQAEYKLADKSNSGIYLRGRYEMQVLADYGQPAGKARPHVAVRVGAARSSTPASPPANGSRSTSSLSATVSPRRSTARRCRTTLRFRRSPAAHSMPTRPSPGPILIQGDHTKVWFKKITVTPIL